MTESKVKRVKSLALRGCGEDSYSVNVIVNNQNKTVSVTESKERMGLKKEGVLTLFNSTEMSPERENFKKLQSV